MKKHYKTWALVALLPIVLFTACKEETIDVTTVQGYEYFPTTQGRYNQFKVDSIAWNSFSQTVDTFRFDIRELNDSLFLDNANDTTVRLERLRRDSSNGAWYVKDIWSMKRTPNTAEKVEENIRYVKLRFPVKEGGTWNGNIFNTIGNWDYEFTDVDKPFTVNGVTYPNTVTVKQTGTNDALINKQIGKEVYAKGIGLIYKELMITEAYTDADTLSVPYDQRIKSGFKLSMSLTDYFPQ